MLDELRLSSEPKYLVDAAMKYLRGLKGHLVQNKRVAKARAEGTLPSGPGNGVLAAQSYSERLGLAEGYQQAVRNGVAPGIPGVPGMSNGNTRPSGPQQGSEAWDQLPVEDRLQGALAEFGQ
jgi:hypothetical protein